MSGIAQCLNGPVKAGDMVQTALPTVCCGSPLSVGMRNRVARIERAMARCDRCGAVSDDLVLILDDGSADVASVFIRIDPPALPESVETDREAVA